MEYQTPLTRYRHHGLRVTDLRDQVWCEKQLEFTLEHGREETPAMKEGSERHQALHEEVTTVVKVRPQTREDLWAFYLFNALAALQLLSKKRICRKIPVFGPLDDIWLLGIIDQLLHNENGNLELTDTKTRQKPTLPSAAQKNSSRLQMMLYKKLYDQLQQGKLKADAFFAMTQLDPQSPLSPGFLAEMQAIGLPSEKLDILFQLVFKAFRQAPPLAPQMIIRYEWQQDHQLLGEDRFDYNKNWLARQLKQCLPFWHGQRVAQGVSYADRWKCRYCKFRTQCPVAPG